MNVIEAKAKMRELGFKAAQVRTDDKMTNAEKLKHLELMTVELKDASETIKVDEEARKFFTGGEVADEQRLNETPKFKTIGEEFVASSAYRAAVESKSAGKRFTVSTELGLKTAATMTEGTTIANGQLNGAGGVLSLPDYQPGIVDLRFAALTVQQLFAQQATSSGIVSYVKETSETQGAAATAEATLKGQADATFARLNEQVGKTAVFFKETDELVQDVPQLQSFMQNRLIGQVQRSEENGVLNGTGYPGINGVIGRTGLQTAISASGATDPTVVIDAVYRQVTAIRTIGFVEPDNVVMNPADWQNIRLSKDKNGQYYAGGPFTGAYGNGGYSNIEALWGLRVVLSPRIASGTALVGGFQECGSFFRRQGITVEMANQNEDDFVNNLITVRGESRGALVIYRPEGFGKVTIAWV